MTHGIGMHRHIAAIAIVFVCSTASAQHDRLGMEGATAEERGRNLFDWVWEPTTLPRGPGKADGLGPLFNARSCSECHHQGGSGGSGSNRHDIEILSLRLRGNRLSMQLPESAGKIHAGFRSSPEVVLHRFSTDPTYATYRESVPGPHGDVVAEITRRNTPSLFGAGEIDKISDRTILDEAARQEQSGLRGRVGRTTDGRVGKFGWKATKATLREFVELAAAGELGLETASERQAADPRGGSKPSEAVDLGTAQIESLTAFVASLPKPQHDPGVISDSGRELFRQIGCADCHVPNLGRATGIHSDLLLHQMSAEDEAVRPDPAEASATKVRPGEWRTPPLWGVRHSAPYLHDGSAATLDQAIRTHGGEGAAAAEAYNRLDGNRQNDVLNYLKSL